MSGTDDQGRKATGTENTHGWLMPERVPATQYTPKFLSDRRAQGQVLAVDESWTLDDQHKLPPGIRWVLYPNGDLLNVGVY